MRQFRTILIVGSAVIIALFTAISIIAETFTVPVTVTWTESVKIVDTPGGTYADYSTIPPGQYVVQEVFHYVDEKHSETRKIKVEVDGETQESEALSEETRKKIDEQIASALDDFAETLSSSSSQSYQVLPPTIPNGVKIQDGHIVDSEGKAVENLNAVLTRDPARFSTGRLVTREPDIELSVDGMSVRVERMHVSEEFHRGIFGPRWSSSLDARIIRGRKFDAERIESELFIQQRDNYAFWDRANREYKALLVEIDKGLQELGRQREKTLESIEARRKTIGTSGYPEIDNLFQSRYLDAVELRDRIDANIRELTDKANTLRGTQKSVLDGIWDEYSERNLSWKNAVKESLEARNAEALSARVSDALDPESWKFVGNDHLTLIDEDGSPHVFRFSKAPAYESELRYASGEINFYPEGTDLVSEGLFAESLRLLPDGRYLWTRRNHETWTFNVYGQLIRREDRFGNFLNFEYEGVRLHQISDSRDRVLLGFEYSTDGVLRTLRDLAGRQVHYAYESSGRLSSVTDVDGRTRRYEYDSRGNLLKIVKPDGSFREYHYRLVSAIPQARVVADLQIDEEGGTETSLYGDSYTDYTMGNSVVERHYFDSRQRETRVDYPDGRSKLFEYDDRDRVTRELSSDGERVAFTYDSRDNLLSRTNADGTFEQWTYDSENNLASATDPRGNTIVHTYENGLPSETRFPDGSLETYHYSAQGRLIESVNANGLLTRYEYDADGNISGRTESSDAQTRTERFSLDSLGRLIHHVDAEGSDTYFEYYPGGDLRRIHHPDGSSEYFTRDIRGDLVRHENRLYATLTVLLSMNGEELDNRANYVLLDWTDFDYDKRHLLLSRRNSLGEETRYEYGKSTFVTRRSEFDSDGNLAHVSDFEYDRAGRIHIITESGPGFPQALSREIRYDDAGRPRLIRDRSGNWTRYHYQPGSRVDEIERLTHGVDPESSDYSLFQKISYDHGQAVETEDFRGQRRAYYYDDRNRLERVDVLAESGWKTFAQYGYDPMGNVLSETTPSGSTISRSYNAWGELISDREKARESGEESVSHQYFYDRRGLRVGMLDSQGVRTNYAFDSMRRLVETSTRDSRGTIQFHCIYTYRYENGLLTVAETDERGKVREKTFDRLGRVILEKNAYGKFGHYEYSVYGTVRKYTDETGLVRNYEFDALGRRISEKLGEKPSRRWEYDGEGRVTAVEDGAGRRSEYRYDAFGRILWEHHGEGPEAVETTYDYTGNQVTRRTGDFFHRYRYDLLGNLETEIDTQGREQKTEYDMAGNLISKTDYAQRTITYQYDSFNNRTAAFSKSIPLNEIRYNSRGQVESARNENGALKYSYDDFGRLVEQTELNGNRTRYSYGPGDLLLSTHDLASGSHIEYGYGAEGEILELHTAPDDNWIKVKYDDAGREILSERSNGTFLEKSYDDEGRLAWIRELSSESDSGGGTSGLRPGWGEAYVYDASGKISLRIGLDGSITAYEYDSVGRLKAVQYPADGGEREADRVQARSFGLGASEGQRATQSLRTTPSQRLEGEALYREMAGILRGGPIWNESVWEENFEFDSRGNRTVVRNGFGALISRFDEDNRMTTSGNKRYGYDPAGMLISEDGPLEHISYSYNYDYRMSAVRRSADLTKDDDQQVLYFEYDALGRRSARTDAKAGIVQSFEYSGLGTELSGRSSSGIENSLQRLGETQSGGRYRAVPVEPESVLRTKPGREVLVNFAGVPAYSQTNFGASFYSADRLGSPRIVRDRSGAVQENFDFDAFGRSIGGKQPEYLGYSGKPMDPELQTYDYGFRDYSPETGRFTTSDPVQDGENWYAYVNGDPANYVDSNGLRTGDSVSDIGTEYRVYKPQVKSQVSSRPKDFHCDINSWNQAINQGFDPRPPSGISWDGNALKADEIYKFYDDSATPLPIQDTSGLGFVSFDGKTVTHIFFYTYGDGYFYQLWDSNGIDDQIEQLQQIGQYGIKFKSIYFTPLVGMKDSQGNPLYGKTNIKGY